MRKRVIWMLAACLLLAGCGGKADMVGVTVVTQEPEREAYPIVETLASPDGVYTAEARTCRTYAEVFVREESSGAQWKFALPDGGPIPEYTFLPEDWGEWLEPNTLLLTVGQGGDAGEQHTYRCSVEMDGKVLTAVSVLEQTGDVLDADYDFTHDGQLDTLECMTLLDPDTGEALWHELWLRNGAGERVWSYAMAAGGPSWDTSLFAIEQDGQDCLVELVTAMGQGYCSYFYEVFALDESGQREPYESSKVQFDVNFGSPIHESFDCDAIADFLWRIKVLTAQADSLLMDVDVTDGLRCHVPATVFEHSYHCGEFVALNSRKEMESALRQKAAVAELMEVLPGTYDFDHNGEMETLELVGNGGESVETCSFWVLRLKDAAGEVLWSDWAGTSHAGENNLFACRIDGQDYLLRYHPWMGQGYAALQYELFSLDENGGEVVLRENGVAFDNNFNSPHHEEIDLEGVAAFLEEVHGYLDASTLLLATDGGRFSSGGSGTDFEEVIFQGAELYQGSGILDNLRAWEQAAKTEQGVS